MNKRQKKKTGYWKERTEALEYAAARLRSVMGLNEALRKELQHWKERSSGLGSSEALVSYHIEDSNYYMELRSPRFNRPTDVHIVHKLRVNAPLCIDHHGPLTEKDAWYLADTLAEAVHTAVLKQLEESILGGRNASTI